MQIVVYGNSIMHR